jgi:hypothetical protein
MGGAELIREILDRAAEFDGAAIGARIGHEIVALARGTNVALLQAGAPAHDLARQRGGEGLRDFPILGEGREQRSFRIDAPPHRCRQWCRSDTREKTASIGDGFAGTGNIENDFVAGSIDARKADAAGNDFVESGGLVAETRQRLAGFQLAVDSR